MSTVNISLLLKHYIWLFFLIFLKLFSVLYLHETWHLVIWIFNIIMCVLSSSLAASLISSFHPQHLIFYRLKNECVFFLSYLDQCILGLSFGRCSWSLVYWIVVARSLKYYFVHRRSGPSIGCCCFFLELMATITAPSFFSFGLHKKLKWCCSLPGACCISAFHALTIIKHDVALWHYCCE